MINSIKMIYQKIQHIENKLANYPNYINNKFSSIYNKYNSNEVYLSETKPLFNDEKKLNQKTSLKEFNIKNALNKEPLALKSSKNLFKQKLNNEIDGAILKASKKYLLPKNLIRTIIKHESNFNPKAISRSGAKGLMQLMPKTAKMLGVKNVFNPQENILAGSKYFRKLLNIFNGDLKLSLASYNSGVTRVLKLNRVPNIKETKNYVKNILNDYYNQEDYKL